jgi:hypothetical protein
LPKATRFAVLVNPANVTSTESTSTAARPDSKLADPLCCHPG